MKLLQAKIFLILSLFTFSALVNFCINKDDKTTEQQANNFNEVEKLISDAIADKIFPGAVLLVYKDGRIIYENGFGYFTYDSTSSHVTKNTIYDLASLTKVIATTTAAMLCTDKNYFSLDDPVSKYIPEFTGRDKEIVNIKNLLLHNSGLPAFKKYHALNLSADEILKDIYHTELIYRPGEKSIYSDLGMILLGKIIEKVSGKTLDDFCKTEIFEPLGMSNTFFNPPDSLKYKIAPTEVDIYWRNKLVWGKVHDETAALLGGVAGHAGLFSKVEDISKLAATLLNKGSFNGRQLIKKETVKLFTTRYSDKSLRALGWDTKSEHGSSAGNLFSANSYGHTGFTGTSIWIDPVKNLFVVFLTNRVYPSRDNKKIIEFRPLLHDAVINALN